MSFRLAGCSQTILVILSIGLLSFWLGTALNRSFVAGPKDEIYRYSENQGKGEFKVVPSPERLSTSFERIDLEELKKAVARKEVILLDGRSEKEFERGHLPGAHSLSVVNFEARFPQVSSLFSKKDSLVVYCGSGDCNLSQRLATLLQERGYIHIRIFYGGYNQWFLGSNPVVRGEDTP